jgi:anti-sigma B factor antagonist
MSHRDVLRITVEAVEEARLVRVTGEIDASTAGELRRHVLDGRDEGTALLLDLAEVDFIDSTGLRVLIDASSHSADTGWPFFIVRPSATVLRLIALTGSAPELAMVEPSESTASRVLRRGAAIRGGHRPREAA